MPKYQMTIDRLLKNYAQNSMISFQQILVILERLLYWRLKLILVIVHQRELEILEKAGVIVRSVSPWANPIVVVPKRTAPGEPPKQRLCVDYRALNSLLPPVKKAYSKAKGILTLVPLPKIDEIYARLKDSTIYSTFDMRSGYYHMALSEKSRPKSTFVSSFSKWEFKRCPFGLAQAPAYFQRLINEVLLGLTFAFGYLDDILVYSPDMETHLTHLRRLFMKL